MANTIRLKRASGSDPGASDLVTGELAVRTDTGKLFTKKDDNSVTEIGLTGNAATATKLETARTIAGVSFDGSANISLNNNAITNGAGYITATLTNEQVQDIVGGMLTGNTETGITVTYQDGDGTIDFVVGTLNQDTTGNAATATALETARNIGGVSFDGTGNINLPGVNTSGNQDTSGNAASADSVDVSGVTTNAALQVLFSTDNDGQAKTIAVDSTSSKFTYNPSSNTLAVDTVLGNLTGNVTGNISGSSGSCTGNAATATTLATARTIAGVSFDGSANISLNNNAITNGAGYITSADGGNAATLDSIDSSQFLRSDTADTASGVLSISLGLAFGANSKCSAAISSLSDGGTITVDFESGIHHSVTLGGNRTLAANNDENTIGQSGSIFITQDGTGSRTLSYTSAYKFVGGTAPTLSTAANAVDRIDYVIKADDVIHCVISLDVK